QVMAFFRADHIQILGRRGGPPGATLFFRADFLFRGGILPLYLYLDGECLKWFASSDGSW
ncbi:hypothetical protein, partial [Acetobacter persici]|uniref:hypothetical protein n=1 Tax=Acetobacter persici TaxID=1076596 RepID=UPI0039ED57E6